MKLANMTTPELEDVLLVLYDMHQHAAEGMASPGSGLADGSRGTLMKMCTEVSEFCPVERTVLAYYPNLAANIFFAVAFGLVFVLAAVLGTWKKTWAFTAAVATGTALEAAGYVGRVLLHYNPWNTDAFELQICAIILGPTLVCAAIYLTLKHVTMNLHPPLSRVRPALYPWIFLPADLSCLVVQAIGGGLAAMAGQTNRSMLDGGNKAIVAGVSMQVAVLLGFGGLAADYWVRARRFLGEDDDSEPMLDAENRRALGLYREPRFRKFVLAVSAAYGCVTARCIYRIAEMAGGWGNRIMQDEVSFMIFDSGFMLFAVILLTAYHPGLYFPQMAGGGNTMQGGMILDDQGEDINLPKLEAGAERATSTNNITTWRPLPSAEV